MSLSSITHECCLLVCLFFFGLLEQVRAALRDDAILEMVSTEEQRDVAIALSTEQENWLYDDGWDMDAATYRKKRAELAEVGGTALVLCFERSVFVEFDLMLPLSPPFVVAFLFTTVCFQRGRTVFAVAPRLAE